MNLKRLLCVIVLAAIILVPCTAFADEGEGKSYIGGPIMRWDTMVEELYELDAVSSDINVFTLAETFGEDRLSERDRDLYYVKVGSGDTILWIQAQIHGNEKLTTVGLMEWLWKIATDAEYAATLKDLTIYVIPIYNPDGCILAQRGTDVFNEAGVRTNANFDLNRDWKVNLAGEGFGFVAKESRNWYELWCAVQADYALDLHHQTTKSITPVNTVVNGTGARAITMSIGTALYLDGPTLPRLFNGAYNTAMKQMDSYVYESIRDDVRRMHYPTWETTNPLWYPIDLYDGIEIFGGVVSGMTLGINYNGLNPYNWSAPHIFFESEAQHTGWTSASSGAQLDLTTRWYNIAMQNYYGLIAFCRAMATGEYKAVDPDNYYNIPYRTAARPATPSSRDYNAALVAAMNFDYLEARVIEGSAWVDAYVTKLNGNKNDLTITIYEKWSDKSIRPIVETFSINNNAADIYDVDGYQIYIDTKGNTQVRECYIVAYPATITPEIEPAMFALDFYDEILIVDDVM